MTTRQKLETDARRAAAQLVARMGLDPRDASVSTLRSRISRGQARIVCAVSIPGHPEMILKHAPGERAAWFAGQITAQSRAAEIFAGSAELAVPRILISDVDARVFLMERAAGLTAHDAMLLAPNGTARLAILALCGRWAGHLHRSGAHRFAPLDPGPVLRRLRQWRAAVVSGALTVPEPEDFLDLCAGAIDRAESDRGAKASRMPAHGDLSLRNLMVSESGVVTGLDFGATEPRPTARDLSRLLITHATYFGPVDGEGADSMAAARETVLTAHGGRWRDRAGLDHAMMADLLLIWQSIPADPARRGIVQDRRWRGIRATARQLFSA